ncbi:uncharacterized protein Triagg1_3559 [Trichoderma aggressivum f. europaeum]|uniref:Major facilitator superfamily (MFS) profile domain-containing protein n=1 Tax=Trichoderma aggressivum f. europaeum TaxID=173218 RepID=A0AAE1M4H2_9HYPO|nr:hypothetical protein Triagg1_3559 [Trichoderma aggressivum f. europaeum]
MEHTASDASSPHPVKDFRFRVVILCLCICCFIASLDTIILSSTLPAIAASLQATTTDAYWCSASFLFAQSVVQLIYAVVARALNRRICMLAALGFFEALRASYALRLVTYSGSLLRGQVFWINLPICVPTMVGFAWCLDAPPRQSSVWTAIKKTDWGGGIIFTFCSHSYLGAAILMLPATLTFPPSAAIAGHIIGRTLKYQLANIIGFAILVGGLSGSANLDEFSSHPNQ